MIQRSDRLPTALEASSRWQRLGAAGVPAMIVHPHWPDSSARPEGPAGSRGGGSPAAPPPVVIWMHGRTARKEIDPGRYLRLMRAGIAACAVDLPGHGERFEAALQHPDHTLDVVLRMIDEIDVIVEALREMDLFDMRRLGIGGMSAGGMAALSRLCREHPFRCVSVEATTGSWAHQRHREMFRGRSDAEWIDADPMSDLAGWREIPFQALHARHDAWVPFEGQAAFVEALRARYRRPETIDFIVFEHTGAPFEHAGFGKMAAEAKNAQRDFFQRWLV